MRQTDPRYRRRTERWSTARQPLEAPRCNRGTGAAGQQDCQSDARYKARHPADAGLLVRHLCVCRRRDVTHFADQVIANVHCLGRRALEKQIQTVLVSMSLPS